LPVRWEQPHQDLPVFIQGIHALRVRDADLIVKTYLSAYGALPPATIRCPCRALDLAPRRWPLRTLSAFGIPDYLGAYGAGARLGAHSEKA
jgi:hypothetical protein